MLKLIPVKAIVLSGDDIDRHKRALIGLRKVYQAVVKLHNTLVPLFLRLLADQEATSIPLQVLYILFEKIISDKDHIFDPPVLRDISLQKKLLNW